MSETHAEYYEQHAGAVTAEERQLLKEHEPFIDFRIVESEQAGLSQGRQSRVSVVEYDKGNETFRVLWKRMAAGKGLEETEAVSLGDRLEPYRQSLVAAGWNIPKLFHTQVSTMPGEHQIFSYEQFIKGGDGEKLFEDAAQPNFRKWYLIKEVAHTLYNYSGDSLKRTDVAGARLTLLPHGLDLKLANIVLEQGTDQLYFVDLFGPKELDNEGSWLTYSSKLDSLPEEQLLAVCATREGALLRCWRLAEDKWNNGYQSVEELRREFLSQLRDINIPPEEFTFIQQEIEGGYPWLNNVYQERQI